jgi:hypothetical protein
MAFQCQVDDITNCQCYSLNLSPEEKSFIGETYSDCLCRKCLLELKTSSPLTHSKR